MGIEFNIFSLVLITSAFATGLLSYMLFRRDGIAVRVFGLITAVQSIWAFGYGVELTRETLEGMLFWVKVEYIGVGLIPGLWFLFCITFSGRNRLLTPLNIAAMFVIPVLTIIKVWTNSWHHLHYASVWVDIESGSFPLLGFERGIWYWVHTVYFYIMLAWGTYYLLQNYRHAAPIFRQQTLIVLLGAFTPWFVNFLYLLGFRPFGYLDLTPFAFSITSLVIGFGLLQLKLFDIIPVARDKVIEDMHDGVVVVDNSDRIVFANRVMQSILTSFIQNPIGKPFSEVCNKETLLSMLRNRVNARVEAELEMKGDTRIFEVNSNPLFDKDNAHNGMLLVFHDITEQKKNEEDLIRAREKAEESDRLKTSFLANMSHEIRNPLNGIIGFASLMRDDASSEEERIRYAEIIEKKAQHLLFIINDIIDISKIESGQERIKADVISISALMTELSNFFFEDASKKGIQLTFTSAVSSANEKIVTDPTKLRQILVNLVGNALKFTDEGNVTVRVRKEQDFLLFKVSDTGIGIPKEDFEIIFDRFRQSENVKNSTRGTGLGLSISRGYASMLGGTINVESKHGIGSTFILKIPHIIAVEKQSHTVDKTMQKTPPVIPNWSSKTILLAEDEPVNVMYIQIALKKTGLKILVANTGIEAIDQFKQNSNISLILMDIKMPEMDGFEAAENIKKLNDKVPIVALSGHAMVEKERLDEAGFATLISKPVRKDDLIEALIPWLGK